MKTIGLLGGMSWESTVTYYRLINETVKAQLGGLHSARLLLYSVDFAEIESQQATGAWAESAEVLAAAAQRLERAGADFLVIATNTMHKVASAIQAAIGIPILHIADATADALLKDGVTSVGLLGTKYTMTEGFYKERLKARGLSVVMPAERDMDLINRVIYAELCLGEIRDESRQRFRDIICRLQGYGAEAVILGCTEIGLLIHPADSVLPVFDTTVIHATAAAFHALDESLQR